MSRYNSGYGGSSRGYNRPYRGFNRYNNREGEYRDRDFNRRYRGFNHYDVDTRDAERQSRGRYRGRGRSGYGSRSPRGWDRSRSPSIRDTLSRLGLDQAQIQTVLNMKPNTNASTVDRDLTECCTTYAKLFNHTQNWRGFPKTLQRSLDNFIDNIHLPLTSDSVQEALFKASRDFSENICEIVQQHLRLKSTELLSNIKYSSENDLRDSQNQAARNLKLSYGRIRDAWAAMFTDLQLHQFSRRDVSQTLHCPLQDGTGSNAHMQVITVEAEVHREQDNTGLKSTTTDILPPIIPNSDLPVDLCDNPKRKQTSPPLEAIQCKKQHVEFLGMNDSTSSDEADGTCIVHGVKSDLGQWKISSIPSTYSSLVVGDSNMRSWSYNLHKQVYVQGFPGATIVDISRILVNWDVPRNIKNIVVCVGVNNYTKTEVQNTNEMRELIDILHNIHGIKTFFVEIHACSSHTPQAIERIEKINAIARREFGDYFIELAKPVLYQDTQHYDKASALRISTKTYSFLH